MSTVIMEVNTEGFWNVSTQRHENIKNGITSPATSLVFLHAAKETQTLARPATPKSQSSGVAPAAGHLDASTTNQNGKVAVAIKQSKRERLMRWAWASTLSLVACEDATFEEEHWRKLKDFMDFWDRIITLGGFVVCHLEISPLHWSRLLRNPVQAGSVE